MFKKYRKKLNISNDELDKFVGNHSVSSKYYLEKSYLTNKIFLYLVLLRLKGVNLNSFFDDVIKENFSKEKNKHGK